MGMAATTNATVAAAAGVCKRVFVETATPSSSVLFRQSPRQTLSQTRCIVVSGIFSDLVSSSRRGIVTNKKKNAGSSSEDSTSLSYFEDKAAKKNQRVEAYQDKLKRVARIKSRRDNSPKDVLKNNFRSWWDGRRAYEEQMDRKARQAGMDWTINVTTIVERLPTVMPDKSEFEREFEELQAYLSAHRGKEYPKEFTGIDRDSRPEAYADEELMALLPKSFKPAPRETKADEDGTISTPDRRLKDRVYLMIGDSFPTTEVKLSTNEDDKYDHDCESLLDASLRGLREQLSRGAEIKTKKKKDKFPLDLYCPSQSPLAVRLDVYDQDQQQLMGRYGTKTFFMKVQYDDGSLQGDGIAWLDRMEIVERFHSASKDDEAKFYLCLL